MSTNGLGKAGAESGPQKGLKAGSTADSSGGRGRIEGGGLGLVRVAAVIAASIGGAGSVTFMVRASQHPPRVLLVLFTLWVVSPFLVLAWANVVSRRWSVVVRAMICGVTFVVAVCSLLVYGGVVDVRPAGSANAFLFTIVPPVTWVVMAVGVGVGAQVSRRRLR